MKKFLNEDNQISVISYGSGSEFLTSYGSGSTSQKVPVRFRFHNTAFLINVGIERAEIMLAK
jgi:hypothetical protein